MTDQISDTTAASFQAIFAGFAEKGIAVADIKPHVNVLTFWKWKDHGRSVKKGERGVKVPNAFGSGFTVFHISQTETEAEREARKQAPATPKPTLAPAPKGWDKIEPGPEQTARKPAAPSTRKPAAKRQAKPAARKPVTPQVPAMKGTAPLGIAAKPAAKPAPKGKPDAVRDFSRVVSRAFGMKEEHVANPFDRKPGCIVVSDGSGGKFVTFTMHVPKGYYAIGPELDHNDR